MSPTLQPVDAPRPSRSCTEYEADGAEGVMSQDPWKSYFRAIRKWPLARSTNDVDPQLLPHFTSNLQHHQPRIRAPCRRVPLKIETQLKDQHIS